MTLTAMAPTSHEEMVFGTTFQRTVEWIMGDALRANTAEDWQAAATQLQGLDRLLITMAGGNRLAFLHTIMALSNTIRDAEAMARDADMRDAWAATRSERG